MIKLLYIDLFCGAGGTSTGVERARRNGRPCAKVIACVNHCANAIASHAANHPDALHFTEDIRILDLTELKAHIARMKKLYPGAKVVLWASLECTNFSKAKGGMSRDADSRTLAEHLFRYIEELCPDYIQIENVEEFMTWGPLIYKVVKDKKTGAEYCPLTIKTEKRGKKKVKVHYPTYIPDSEHLAEYYNAWIANVKRYGYHFEHRILNAADYGARTSRKRFFGQFARIGLPIGWPKQTHSKTGQGDLFNPMQKWLPVRDVLDLTDEGESVFDRYRVGKKPLVDSTIDRISAGVIRFVAGGKDKWLLKYNSMNGRTNVHIPPSIDEPCPTISCQNRLGVVQASGFLSKVFSGDPYSKNISLDGPAGSYYD